MNEKGNSIIFQLLCRLKNRGRRVSDSQLAIFVSSKAKLTLHRWLRGASEVAFSQLYTDILMLLGVT